MRTGRPRLTVRSARDAAVPRAMRIPRYWARAAVSRPIGDETFVTEAFGHSDRSVEDAERDARERGLRVARRFEDLHGGREPADLGRYGYASDRPMREPVVRELRTEPGGERFAAITRNGYGALVLNTANVCFIDVDVAPPRSLLARLFRGQVPTFDQTLDRVRAVADATRLGLRIYRTAAGIRGLVTSELLDPTDRRTAELFDRFGADPRYRALCRIQRCFRARLTPKPWRCGIDAPSWPWPFRDEAHERRFREWLSSYERTIAGFATCELIEQRGPAFHVPLAAAIVREHDAACCRGSHPLA